MSDPDIPDDLNIPANFRSVLFRIAASAVIFAAVNVGMGLALDRARARCGDGESGVICNARKVGADVLILGSSRAKHHYDDGLLERLWGVRVFNAGFGGQGIPFSRIVLEQVATIRKPRAVIIDVMLFAEDMERVHALDPWYNDSAILRSLPDPDAKAGETRVAGGDWKTTTLMRTPLYRYAGKAWNTLKGARKPESDTGYLALTGDKPMAGTARNRESKPSPWLIPQLDSLVNEARALGAEVVLCFSPVKSDAYALSIVSPVAEYAKAKGVAFVEFDAKRFQEFADEKLFRDTDHLNAEGADAFTRVAAKTLAPLLPKTLGETKAPSK